MCNCVSWIVLPNGDIKFLTGDQLFRTEKGKNLLKKDLNSDDWPGHEFIRKYYNITRLKGGCQERECTDFSSPENFPPEIADAIKKGKYRGFISRHILELLTTDALKIYAERQKAYAEWEKADAEWEKADAEWEKADAERKKADAEWKKADAENGVFWDLFANSENRTELWR